MRQGRREFFGQAAFGAAAVVGMSAIPANVASALGIVPEPASDDYDLSWVKRITGKHRAVFDIPEVESAYGIWRSQFWGGQMQEVFRTDPKELSTVVVLRHNGILLAMKQNYWDAYGVGKESRATHPVTMQATERNPALLSSTRGEVPAQFDPLALDKVIESGAIVLACNVALEFYVVPKIAEREGVDTEEARKRARAYMVPGVVVQPSGVFAALVAQEAGCKYLRAS